MVKQPAVWIGTQFSVANSGWNNSHLYNGAINGKDISSRSRGRVRKVFLFTTSRCFEPSIMCVKS